MSRIGSGREGNLGVWLTLAVVLALAGCGRAPAATTVFSPIPVAATAAAPPNPKAAPSGIPEAYGWDGVDGEMMISAALRHGITLEDPSTWTFNGTEWTQAPTPPGADYGPGSVLVYDSKLGKEVLVTTSSPAETWLWDGTSWQKQSTPHAPQLLTQNVSGAYSPELGATVVLDTGVVEPLGPTWLFDGADWRSVATAHQPDGYAQLEYDATRKSIVALSLTDYRTWLFDGIDWVPLSLDGPTPAVTEGMGRQMPSIALDQQRDVWVVFGGFDGSNMLTDTWTGSGTSWTQQTPATSPVQRTGVPGKDNLAWDPTGRRLLLFGGHASFDGADLGDTWAWDGASWTQVSGPAPTPTN